MPCVSLAHRRIYRALITPQKSKMVKAKNSDLLPEKAKQRKLSRAGQYRAHQNYHADEMIAKNRHVSSPAKANRPKKLVENEKVYVRAPRATSASSAKTKRPKTVMSPRRAQRTLEKIVKKSQRQRAQSRRRLSRAELINAESKLGSMLFGPIPAGHRREFFHDRENIWIWHEAWADQSRHPHQLTIRYEVRPSGVYKKISAGKYFRLEGSELANFRKATRAYLQLVKQKLYHAQ